MAAVRSSRRGEVVSKELQSKKVDEQGLDMSDLVARPELITTRFCFSYTLMRSISESAVVFWANAIFAFKQARVIREYLNGFIE